MYAWNLMIEALRQRNESLDQRDEIQNKYNALVEAAKENVKACDGLVKRDCEILDENAKLRAEVKELRQGFKVAHNSSITLRSMYRSASEDARTAHQDKVMWINRVNELEATIRQAILYIKENYSTNRLWVVLNKAINGDPRACSEAERNSSSTSNAKP